MIAFVAPLFKWPGGNWYFVRLPEEAAIEARFESGGLRGGFGSIKVAARVGLTEWRTSIFPEKESGSFLLPMKAAVRHAESLTEGEAVDVRLDVAG
ncbi:DUF1905 domain-containing protein [Sphingomicrobium nitratireducens]|uniref:DUF1905 domain-containing protein n=1 Tax=Sphingomicrobium nitratireducens TaxID=2964666 RepID=UPI00223EF017|nr:DUF1905 domain-containing protein [Sphingomicrobium nitratireducens]